MHRFNNDRKATTRRNIIRDENHPNNADRYGFHPWDEVTRTTSDVTSLNYMPATGALAVTSQGSDRPPEIFLTDPGRDEPVGFIPKLSSMAFDVNKC